MRYLVTILLSTAVLFMVAFAAPPARAGDTVEDLEKAYRSYIAAALAKDWEKLSDSVSKETRKEMDALPEKNRDGALGFLHDVMGHTKRSIVDSGKVDGTTGTLKVHVPKKKGSITGEIFLRKEDGRWRMHTQKWNETD